MKNDDDDRSKPWMLKYMGQQKGAAKKHIIEKITSDPAAMVRVGNYLVKVGCSLNDINIFGLTLASKIAHLK